MPVRTIASIGDQFWAHSEPSSCKNDQIDEWMDPLNTFWSSTIVVICEKQCAQRETSGYTKIKTAFPNKALNPKQLFMRNLCTAFFVDPREVCTLWVKKLWWEVWLMLAGSEMLREWNKNKANRWESNGGYYSYKSMVTYDGKYVPYKNGYLKTVLSLFVNYM